MDRLRSSPATLALLLALACLILPAHSLYFYLEGTQPKCFYEDLPQNTLVVGHFHAEEFSQSSQRYESNPDLGVIITVNEVFDNHHTVVNQKGADKGRVTFTAAASGEHKICFQAWSKAPNPGWLASGHVLGGVKLTLDMAVGETSELENKHKNKVDDLVNKVMELNGRLADYRREQIFQREREAEFRDQSETTNARVVRWTLLQLAILGVTCAWQLSHLKAFFVKQKLT